MSWLINIYGTNTYVQAGDDGYSEISDLPDLPTEAIPGVWLQVRIKGVEYDTKAATDAKEATGAVGRGIVNAVEYYKVDLMPLAYPATVNYRNLLAQLLNNWVYLEKGNYSDDDIHPDDKAICGVLVGWEAPDDFTNANKKISFTLRKIFPYNNG
jgi:hypothetical protein